MLDSTLGWGDKIKLLITLSLPLSFRPLGPHVHLRCARSSMQRLTNRERAASFEHMPLKILKVAKVSINRRLVK